jgi:HK97 family phage portal protein
MATTNIVERARVALKVFRHGFSQRGGFERKAAPFIWPNWRDERPQWQLVDFGAYCEEGFNLNTVVYSAVMYKARSLMQVSLRAYTGNRDNPDPLPESDPLSRLVARPNLHQSWAEFQVQCAVYLNIAGNCYIYVDRKPGKEIPEALYVLRPDRTFVVPLGPSKGHIGYLYLPEGSTLGGGQPVLAKDMMHIKLPNPLDSLEGMGQGLSPLSPAARSTDVDNSVTHFLKLFFDKGVMLPGLVSVKGYADDATAARIKERWKEMYGGYRNWAEEVAVLDEGATYERIGLTFDEMGFSDLDERNESRICGPFGVPPILIGTRLGLMRSTYANYREARRACWEDTLVPESKLFEKEFQYYLQGDDSWVAYDYSDVRALQQDIPALTNAARTMWDMGVPADEAFTAVGLRVPKIPGGDRGYLPFSLVATGRMPAPSATTPEPETEPTDQPVEVEEDTEERPKALQKSNRLTREQKTAFWKQMDTQATSWEPAFGDAATEAFANDLREILVLVNEAKSKALERKQTIGWSDTLLQVQHYLTAAGEDNWREVFAPVIAGLITERGEELAVQFGIAFDVQNLLAQEWFTDYVIQFAQPILETTNEAMTTMFQQAMGEGWSIHDMTKHLESIFQQWMKGNLSKEDFEWFEARMPFYRRENIARTETVGASNIGSYELYKEWGAPKKEWLATMDKRTRDDHLAANGQIRFIDEPFEVGGVGMQYPGDKNAPAGQICNCRCTVLPILEDV